MFVVKLMRWIKGYVTFVVSGAFTERFLNLLARAGIAIWNVTKQEEDLVAFTVARDYKKLRPYARRAGVRLRVKKRYGLPFYTRKYNKRAGLILGIVIFFTFIFTMSQFVWSVEISGNKEITQFELMQVLESEGIKPGVLKRDIDISIAKQNIMRKIDRLSWIAINISGTSAYVEVRERVLQPEMETVDVPSNIVAARSGQIIRVEVHDGQAVVKKGDSVKEGDLLVSGLMQGKTGLNLLTHSSAKVIAQIQEEKIFDIPLVVEVSDETGKRRTKRMISFLNAEIPIWFCGPIDFDYRLESIRTPLTLFGAKLPLYYKQEVHYELVKHKKAVSVEEAKKAAAHLIADYETNVLNIVEVISRDISVKKERDRYSVTVKLVANADIAREQEIFIENSK